MWCSAAVVLPDSSVVTFKCYYCQYSSAVSVKNSEVIEAQTTTTARQTTTLMSDSYQGFTETFSINNLKLEYLH